MWTYNNSNGELSHNGEKVATGYSGHGEGKNNPSMMNVHAVGPIPVGTWRIGPPCDTLSHGPYVMSLSPMAETETFGRGGFLIHGDNIQHPGEASLGCIIMPRPIRVKIWESGDHTIQVV